MPFIDFLMSILESLTDMLRNVVILFALVFLYGSTNISFKPKTAAVKIVHGLIIGGFAVLIMLFPWQFGDGLIFDSRSVLFVITGAFFSPLTTLVAAIIGVTYRILAVGGAGIYAGVLTMISCSLIGYGWQKWHHKLPKMNGFTAFYLLGVLAHVATVLSQFALPWETFVEIYPTVIPVFLGLYPFAVAILGVSMHHQIERINNALQLKRERLLLQAAIDSPREMEIFVVDTNYHYLSLNSFHRRSIEKYYNYTPKIGQNFLEIITFDAMRERIKSCIDKAFQGQTFTQIDEVENITGKYLENIYSPIYDENNRISGVTVFSHDVSDRKSYEQSILYLSYHDSLTGLKNRRFYSEELVRLDSKEAIPLSVVMADINGLKLMNDAFGHDAGDELLRVVASELNLTFQSKGVVARIGGDEFVVMMEKTSKDKALDLIETCRTAIEKHRLYGMDVSVSFGLDTKTDGMSIEEIIKIAEDDMYKHKLFETASNRNEAIKAIMNTLHLKNPREQRHSARVSELCQKIGRQLGLRKDEIDLLGVVGKLHDIGKISISEHILNKPGKLTEEEWLDIKRHPEIGYRIISSSGEYQEISEDILMHHERWDGKGYPQGIKGDNIPLRARIIAIADAFDAMTSERPYRGAMSETDAIEEIKRCSGTQFDPEIATTFVDSFRSNFEG